MKDPWSQLNELGRAPQPSTGFVDNFEASVGQVVDEGLSISEYLHTSERRDRNARIRDMLVSGEIDETLARPFVHRGRRGSRFDYADLAELAKEVDPTIKLDEELEEEMQAELAMRREYAEGVFEKADTAGFAGQLAGGVAATALDPALWPGFAFGPTGAVSATTALRAFGQGAAKVGAFTAGEEALIQSQVMDWKERIGAEYNYTDAAVAIAGAGVLGGTVGGFSGYLSNLISGRNLPAETIPGHQEWTAGEGDAAARTLRQMEMETAQAPDPDMPLQEFTGGMDAQEELLNAPPAVQARPLDEIMPESDEIALDEALDVSMQERMADMEFEDGRTARQELMELDVEEQRLLQLRECLRGG